MRYHYQFSEGSGTAGKVYLCDHPLYSRCTLFKEGEVGLAVVQLSFNHWLKNLFWEPIHPYLASDIFKNENFKTVFDSLSGQPDENGIYPTVNVRSLMWALRMPPLEKTESDVEFTISELKSRKNTPL